jgi:hypothetical protein
VDPFDTSGVPPVLVTLLTPWLNAIEISASGIGEHVTATAAHSFMALRRRIELTPSLEQALADARAATDTLATAIDRRRVVPLWIRDAVRKAMIDLIAALRRAEPNAVTRELGLGW